MNELEVEVREREKEGGRERERRGVGRFETRNESENLIDAVVSHMSTSTY